MAKTSMKVKKGKISRDGKASEIMEKILIKEKKKGKISIDRKSSQLSKKEKKKGIINLNDKSGKIKGYRVRKAFKKFRKGNGAIYLSHLPHGFYENEMTSYFQQFGKVLSVKLARSKYTGRSKGYGFVEFADEEVARIAAETMNNYLMYNRILKCSYIPKEKWRGNKFSNITSTNYPRKENRKINLQDKINSIQNANEKDFQRKVQKKVKKITETFQNKGVDFSFKLEV